MIHAFSFSMQRGNSMAEGDGDFQTEKNPYRWVIVLSGIIGLFACLGLGRFSLGMLLPSMGEGLHLSYSLMGLLSTINFFGYLLAVLLCGKLKDMIGFRALICLGLLLVAVTMIGVGCAESFWLITLCYFLTGVGTGLANVPIMGLIPVWFGNTSRGSAAGMCTIGNGLGLLFTGKVVPLLNADGGSWRQSWLVLGFFVLLLAFVNYFLIREKPKVASDQMGTALPEGNAAVVSPKKQLIYFCGAIYFLYGFSYVIYVTFFVTALVQERGMTEAAAGNIWSWIGCISLVSGPLFGYLSDKYGRQFGLMLVFFLQCIAYLLFTLEGVPFSLLISLFCYGLTAWSVPSIMSALIGDYVGPIRATALFGFMTFLFGIGQIVGPAIGGWLGDLSGSFSPAFFLALALTVLAFSLSWLLPAPAEIR